MGDEFFNKMQMADPHTQSEPNLQRRHYPKENDGAKNEWKAMIDHQVEADRRAKQHMENMNNYKKKLQGENLLQQMKYRNQHFGEEERATKAHENEIVTNDL